MALFKECLLAHGYAEYSTKETSQPTSPPSQLFMSGDAALFNAPECPTRLDVFLAEASETLHLNNVTQVHIVQPNRNLAEMERVLHFSSAKHIEAHVYVVTQTRDGATVDESAMEEVLRKRAMLDRWVNMVQKTGLKCKSLTGKCVAPP
jgi:hypothetical protein